MRRTTVTARDGVQLAVTEYGTATAERTVILLHGLCLTQQAWEPQTRFLEQNSAPHFVLSPTTTAATAGRAPLTCAPTPSSSSPTTLTR